MEASRTTTTTTMVVVIDVVILCMLGGKISQTTTITKTFIRMERVIKNYIRIQYSERNNKIKK